jgi:hypothetical protein
LSATLGLALHVRGENTGWYEISDWMDILAMRDALEILGYNAVHHMQSIFANPLQNEMWAEAINAKFFGRGKPYGKEEWDQLLGHCQVRLKLLAF